MEPVSQHEIAVLIGLPRTTLETVSELQSNLQTVLASGNIVCLAAIQRARLFKSLRDRRGCQTESETASAERGYFLARTFRGLLQLLGPRCFARSCNKKIFQLLARL